jgi:hypothetical protein
MRVHIRGNFGFAIEITFTFLFAGGVSVAPDEPPTWAYGTQGTAANRSGAAAAGTDAARGARATPDNSLEHLPGSASGFTQAQINDRFGPADWYPGDHPKMLR